MILVVAVDERIDFDVVKVYLFVDVIVRFDKASEVNMKFVNVNVVSVSEVQLFQ